MAFELPQESNIIRTKPNDRAGLISSSMYEKRFFPLFCKKTGPLLNDLEQKVLIIFPRR